MAQLEEANEQRRARRYVTPGAPERGECSNGARVAGRPLVDLAAAQREQLGLFTLAHALLKRRLRRRLSLIVGYAEVRRQRRPLPVDVGSPEPRQPPARAGKASESTSRSSARVYASAAERERRERRSLWVACPTARVAVATPYVAHAAKAR